MLPSQSPHKTLNVAGQWRTQDFADVYACIGEGEGGGRGGGGTSHPTPQRKRAREVYALHFVRTSSPGLLVTLLQGLR